MANNTTKLFGRNSPSMTFASFTANDHIQICAFYCSALAQRTHNTHGLGWLVGYGMHKSTFINVFFYIYLLRFRSLLLSAHIIPVHWVGAHTYTRSHPIVCHFACQRSIQSFFFCRFAGRILWPRCVRWLHSSSFAFEHPLHKLFMRQESPCSFGSCICSESIESNTSH